MSLARKPNPRKLLRAHRTVNQLDVYSGVASGSRLKLEMTPYGDKEEVQAEYNGLPLVCAHLKKRSFKIRGFPQIEKVKWCTIGILNKKLDTAYAVFNMLDAWIEGNYIIIRISPHFRNLLVEAIFKWFKFPVPGLNRSQSFCQFFGPMVIIVGSNDNTWYSTGPFRLCNTNSFERFKNGNFKYVESYGYVDDGDDDEDSNTEILDIPDIDVTNIDTAFESINFEKLVADISDT